MLPLCPTAFSHLTSTHIHTPPPALRTQVFGHSPDETAFARIQLNREPAADSMLMIQPTLYSFSFNGEWGAGLKGGVWLECGPAGCCCLGSISQPSADRRPAYD